MAADLNKTNPLRLLHSAANPEARASDRDLLHRFARRNDAAAFEALARRHVGMVSAVARRVLGDAHAAEDVCQAAFLLLARKAGSQRWRPSVAGWLHKTAHLLALKARAATARRVRREGAAPTTRTPANPLAEMTGQELLAVLDEELLALPESLRVPLVLCYLEGATRDEAADRIGCPLPTLKKRLEKGRDRLHAALARRGMGLSAALLGTLLAGPAAVASRGLAAGIARDAAAIAAGTLTHHVISPSVAQLVSGGVGMAGSQKATAALVVLLVSGLVGGGVGATASRPAGGEPPDKPAAVAAPEANRQSADQTRQVRVVVLDPDGRPLPRANIHAGVWTDEKGFQANRDYVTDAEGAARVELPKTYLIVRLWASARPFAGLFANWEQDELASGKRLPAEYTFRLTSAATAGGRVLDEQGRPITGARVEVRLANDSRPLGGDGRARFNTWLATGTDAAATDAEGRWVIDTVPAVSDAELSVLVTHPDFVSDSRWSRPGRGTDATTTALREGTAVSTLKAGVVVRGRVTGPDGTPVRDAVVVHGDDPYGGHATSKFVTDAAGRYRLPALPAGVRSLTVMAAGFAPQLRKVDLTPGLPDQDFRLAPGKPVRLRVVDAAGKPVPGAAVWLMEWKGSKSVYTGHNPNHPKVPDTGAPRLASKEGGWEWRSAPDEPVKVQVSAKGFATLDLEVMGGAADRTVTLHAEHRVTGSVTDAATGAPVRAFTVIPVDVFGKDFLNAERFNAVRGKDGRLDFLATRTDIPLRLRVEAPGYRTRDGPEFRVGSDAGRRQDFRLVTSPPRAGVVLDAEGKPVAGAAVAMATPTEPAGPGSNGHRTTTDPAGRFTFPDPGEPWAVVVRSDAGVATAEYPAETADAGTLTLRPWAAVRGRFRDGGKPVGGATVFVAPVRTDDPGRPRIEAAQQSATDAEGRFEFRRVAPGPVRVRVFLGPWKDEGFRSGPSVPLNLKPGEAAEIDLGFGGATLSGRVKLTGKVPADLDCVYSLNYLVRRQPGIAPPPDVAAAGFDATKGWRDSWHQTREGLAYLATLRHWFVKLAADGGFRVSGVPPGEYDLAVAVYAKPSGCLTDPVARRVVRVTVTPADAARGELAVPEVAAEVVPVPAVGDTPALAFERSDGSAGSLADCRGKHTLVHFWTG